jgi:1-deoxy-D-xylulose-5-phosphate synthase
MEKFLPKIESPRDLLKLSLPELEQLAAEMREVLCNLVSTRTAHFASNLGVVELCLALHTVFDFSRDRLIWDTGHQIYPHKMITGRYHEFGTIRTKGGLMGYPNPHESDYDLFMTGHAGCSVSTVLGLKSGDDLSGESDRHSVAVIGDGAFPSGIVFEALNNIGGLKKKTIVVLNDNKMSICPRVGGVAEFLDRLRISPAYTSLKGEVQKFLENLPVIGEPMERWLGQAKDSFKAGLHHGGMLFEDLGMRYVGPIDGHNLGNLQKLLRLAKDADVPVLLHVVTEKGHGFQPAAADPVFFHTPAPFDCDEECVVSIKQQPSRAYTNAVSEAIYTHLQRNPRASVITAAMCQGNNLEKVRADFPDQFFDTGICESHAVAFAAGQAKAGCRPIVDIYSTFLQRSYDQIFQEVALQNLPVTFLLDRAGLTGPDGPTHHGVFDLGYMRLFPNMVVMAPGDELDIVPMLDFAMTQSSPTSLRYPKAKVESVPRNPQPVELGKAEVLEWGHDGMILACGTQLPSCVKAMQQLRGEGYDIGVINARFVKPLDTEVILRALRTASFVITVEEGALMGGFGSAVLEAACDAGLTTQHLRRLGIPDRFIEHGERNELLAELGLDTAGIVSACRAMADGVGVLKSEQNFNAAGAARSA